MTRELVGAVEAGGTKFRCAAVSSDMTIVESTLLPTTDPDMTIVESTLLPTTDPDMTIVESTLLPTTDPDMTIVESTLLPTTDPDMTIVESTLLPTTDPDTTLAAVAEFFGQAQPVTALGIASFGPVDLDPDSPDYGALVGTPKPGWSGAPILGWLSEALGVPAGIQTDVEAAAVAEQTLGPEPQPRRLAYVTVGTGIGAAVAVDGTPWRGRHHSELGHIPVRRVAGDDYPGHCPFHHDCLEGMACGPAMAERWGVDPAEAGGRDDVWALEAAYLAQLVRVLAYSFAPDRIVFGGGVGSRPGLDRLILEATRADLGGYADYIADDASFVTAPALGDDSGLLGAALIARALVSADLLRHR